MPHMSDTLHLDAINCSPLARLPFALFSKFIRVMQMVELYSEPSQTSKMEHFVSKYASRWYMKLELNQKISLATDGNG